MLPHVVVKIGLHVVLFIQNGANDGQRSNRDRLPIHHDGAWAGRGDREVSKNS